MTSAQWQLDSLAAEIENHVSTAGWDQIPRLFAMVSTRELVASDAGAASSLGLSEHDEIAADALTPIEQEDLPTGDIEQMLAQIGWPESILGCALSQEIVFLPPEADAGFSDEAIASAVQAHPQRREARLVVAVLRDGTASSMLRLRPSATPPSAEAADAPNADDDLLTGQTLAPNLVEALLATFAE
ncbi:hypothetical protein SAMN05444157_2820 [Frankineae bacterium MT45]|nr:hypothetical protein SAMN05444157_2820 [Frankineae bacterium MT45]